MPWCPSSTFILLHDFLHWLIFYMPFWFLSLTCKTHHDFLHRPVDYIMSSSIDLHHDFLHRPVNCNTFAFIQPLLYVMVSFIDPHNTSWFPSSTRGLSRFPSSILSQCHGILHRPTRHQHDFLLSFALIVFWPKLNTSCTANYLCSVTM